MSETEKRNRQYAYDTVAPGADRAAGSAVRAVCDRKPICTVIIPVYNQEARIERCISSALCQSISNIRLIVTDDHSTDATSAVLRKLAAQDDRLHVITNRKNLGTSASRNLAIALADTEWIAFLDSDDVWRADKLQLQLEAAYAQGADIVYTGAICENARGEAMKMTIHVPPRICYEDILKGNDIICSSVLVKRALIRPTDMPENERLHEDYLCWIGLLKRGALAVGLDLPLTTFTIRSGSRSGNKIWSMWMTWCSYKHLGMPLGQRLGCFVCNGLHGIRRYYLNSHKGWQ